MESKYKYENYSLQQCDAGMPGRYLPKFQKKKLPPFAGYKTENRGSMFL
jgi:hypothetical protein